MDSVCLGDYKINWDFPKLKAWDDIVTKNDLKLKITPRPEYQITCVD